MATDDERQRVAAALRKVRVFTLEGRQEDGSVIGWQVALMSDLSKAVGVDDSVGFDTFARLSDLIEPDSHPNLGTQEASTSQVLGRDREMLLALTKDIEEMMVKLSATVRGYEYFVEVPRTLLDSIVSIILEACGADANGLPTARRGDMPARAEKRQDRGVASGSAERAAHEKN